MREIIELMERLRLQNIKISAKCSVCEGIAEVSIFAHNWRCITSVDGGEIEENDEGLNLRCLKCRVDDFA